MLTCRLLGPVEVWCDDRRVDLGYPRQRSLLAILLVEANRLVTLDSLIDRIWGGHPPARATHTLYADVSKLRRVVNPISGLDLARHTGGYRIEADPRTIDLHRFRDLVARAQRGQHDEDTATLLDEALALWHDEPFADLDNPWLSATRASLNREKLAATLDRNDALLRMGKHTNLLTDLATTTAAHPLDERPAAQYMLALYRCGRCADALNHYQHTRQHLVDELGVDPGPELHELHQQILRNDPRLQTTTPAPTPRQLQTVHAGADNGSPACVLRQLPPDLATFTGREAELTRLIDATTAPGVGGPPTVVISAIEGMPGVGKTQFAIHAAHRLVREGRFSDAQLYVNLRGFDPERPPADPAAVLAGFLRQLGVSAQHIPQDLAERAAMFRDRLSGRNALILLDNAVDEHHIANLIPTSPDVLVLITSRRTLAALDGAESFLLDILTPQDAATLLARVAGAERIERQPAAAAEVAAMCGYLPLALSLAAARLKSRPTWSVLDLLEHLRDSGHGAIGVGRRSVRPVFDLSYRGLPQPARLVFSLLGVHPATDITAPAAAALAQLPLADARAALDLLQDEHLVRQHVPGRYAPHDLLRAYAAEQAAAEHSPAQTEAAVHRVLLWYLHSADAAARMITPQRLPALEPGEQRPPGAGRLEFTSGDLALAWLETEYTNLVGAVSAAADHGLHRVAWQLPIALWELFNLNNRWDEWTRANQTAVAAARALGDSTAEARSLVNLGASLRISGHASDAVVPQRQAHALYRASGDQRGAAAALYGLGTLHYDLEQHTEALDALLQALELFQSAELAFGEGYTHTAIGELRERLGDPTTALTHYHTAIAIQKEIGDRRNEAISMTRLGWALHTLGQNDKAITALTEAVNINKEVGHRYDQAIAHKHLGQVRRAHGDTAGAETEISTALDILTELGHADADEVADLLATLRQDQLRRSAPNRAPDDLR